MDYSNESYIRLYTRKTADHAVLCWQARALWPQILAVADRAGVIATKHGARGLAALVEMPREVVDAGLPELLEDGCIREIAGGRGFVVPNYLEAQEAKSSDKQRKREERERRLALALAVEIGAMSQNVTDESRNVTSSHETGQKSHTASHGVTASHTESHPVTLCSALPCSALPIPDLTHPADGEAGFPRSGDRLRQLTEYALRARWDAETKLHQDLAVATPAPANIATASVEALALKAVQGWMLEAPDGAEAAHTVDERLTHLIAVRSAVARSTRSLKFWAPSTFWDPDGIARDIRQTAAQAVAGITPSRDGRRNPRPPDPAANEIGADGFKRGMPPILRRRTAT